MIELDKKTPIKVFFLLEKWNFFNIYYDLGETKYRGELEWQ